MTLPQTAAITAAGLLLLTTAAVAVEDANQKVWNNRAYLPSLIEEPNRHTPLHYEGTFLPPVIDTQLTLTPSDNPVILASTTTITPTGTLTLEPGVTVFAHEYSQLIVQGTLRLNGIANNQILLQRNEVHPLNQVWNGIIAEADSEVTINHATITNASPAITCRPDSNVAIDHSTLLARSMTIFNESDTCTITNSFEKYVRTQ